MSILPIELLQWCRGQCPAVIMDSFCFSNDGKLPPMSLIKLRDLPTDVWNVDTLYILTPDEASAHRLAEIAETEDWGGAVQVHADREEVDRALGSGIGVSPMASGARCPCHKKHFVVSIWWD